MHVLVTNIMPTTDCNIPQPLFDLFTSYYGGDGQSFVPFTHQAQSFRAVMEDEEVFLMAGTAAGKTLAIAIPLFHKLAIGHIRIVLFMYPTIALMDDQRRVMDRLSDITGLEVSQIQGGMSRSRMLAALNKPIILATPDVIHWFFRKNVKYNSILVYALSLVDEFVLDEAHLFNGLMLHNFNHLWQRIQSLAAIIGKSPRLHILTATPTSALHRLNNGVQITGRSRCSDVSVEFHACGQFDRGEAMVSALNSSLSDGKKKVLIVCNSARLAHQLFEQYKVSANAALPITHQLRFGKVDLRELLQWLEQCGIEKKILDGLSVRFLHEENATLNDLPKGTHVTLPLENLISEVTEILERQCQLIKQALWQAKVNPGAMWESTIRNRPFQLTIMAVLRERLQGTSDLEQQKTLIDEWLTDTIDSVSKEAEEHISCQAPDFSDLRQMLSTSLGKQLAEMVLKQLQHELEVNPEWIDISPRNLSSRPIYLRWLGWMVDKENVEHIQMLLQKGIDSGVLKVDCRHLGIWKGTDVPVIVYSGSMTKQARSGLIDVFSDLDRAVLISTSAVEVGVDFAADMLITEECEGNGFLQRFGRVGRHGSNSQVQVLVGGDVASKWNDVNGKSLSREDFSERIIDTFPQRNYAAASEFVDAGHYLVNEQLGRIGKHLNHAPNLAKVQSLADKIRAAEIPVSFGLRSTLPQITLKDGITKDPFYLLRYTDDQELRAAHSTFEVARANLWFTQVIFKKAFFSVMVDLNATLQASRVWFWIAKNQWFLKAQPSIGFQYWNRMCEYYEQHGGWNPLLQGNFMLLHGDVYLQRAELGIDYPTLEPICDDIQNPIFIPAQNYLVFIGWADKAKARDQLAVSPIDNWEELYYDWDGMPFNKALILLEQSTGACFAAYKEWLSYVDNNIKK